MGKITTRKHSHQVIEQWTDRRRSVKCRVSLFHPLMLLKVEGSDELTRVGRGNVPRTVSLRNPSVANIDCFRQSFLNLSHDFCTGSLQFKNRALSPTNSNQSWGKLPTSRREPQSLCRQVSGPHLLRIFLFLVFLAVGLGALCRFLRLLLRDKSVPLTKNQG